MNTITAVPLYSLRAKLLIFLFEITKPIYRAIFKRNKKAWTTSLEDLANYEEYSLGKDFYHFMKKEGFQIEAKLESHDISHVLLQYPTDVPNEIAMQFFCVGVGKKSYYTWFTVITGFLILPEYHKIYQQAYQRGLHAINFQHWDFEHLLSEPTAVLRAQIFNQNQENKLYL